MIMTVDKSRVRYGRNLTPDDATFYVYEGNSLASASLNLIPSVSPTRSFLFSRLIVAPKMRGKGYGKLLLSQVAEWADMTDIVIYLDVNPYGDLDLDQLITLYKRFGFIHYCSSKASLIRYPSTT